MIPLSFWVHLPPWWFLEQHPCIVFLLFGWPLLLWYVCWFHHFAQTLHFRIPPPIVLESPHFLFKCIFQVVSTASCLYPFYMLKSTEVISKAWTSRTSKTINYIFHSKSKMNLKSNPLLSELLKFPVPSLKPALPTILHLLRPKFLILYIFP